MTIPNVKSLIRDTENDVTYEVMAFRALSKAELVMAVRVYHSQRRSKRKHKRGTTVKIFSVIGIND